MLCIKKVFNSLNSFLFIFKLFVLLPYPIWNMTDIFLNKIIKPRFLLIKAEKKNNIPKHPLYLKGDLKPQVYILGDVS